MPHHESSQPSTHNPVDNLLNNPEQAARQAAGFAPSTIRAAVVHSFCAFDHRASYCSGKGFRVIPKSTGSY
jgi:hypothetical protein